MYKEGSQNYFGETYNGSDWYSGSGGKEYFLISVQSGKAWSGDVTARIGDLDISDYDGQGSYRMRVRRYTSSGNPGSEDPNNSSVSIMISVPTSTPIPTDTPVPTDTPTPASNAATATPTPKPTPKPSPKPTQKPSPTTSKKLIATEGGVLGESSESSEINQKPEKTEVLSTKNNNIIPIALILVGIVFLVVCAIVFFYPYIVKFKNKSNNE